MALHRILVHSGKHPFEPFRYDLDYEGTMSLSDRNLGNFVLADAVFKYLCVSPEIEVQSDRYGFSRGRAEMAPELINERFDCLVIPAANWLENGSRDLLRSLTARIRRLKIPCVVTGLGTQASEPDDFSFLTPFAEDARAFLAAILDRSHSISVQGEFTAACMRKLGFSQATVTGCPSFYRSLKNLQVIKKPVDRASFKLAVNGGKVLLAPLKQSLFGQYRSVLFSQGDILKVLKGKWRTPWPDLRFTLSDGFSMELISQGRVRYYGDVTPWAEELKKFDFSLGTRLHGNILALLSGVPAMIIRPDSRPHEMAEFLHIPTVSLQSLQRGFDAHALYQDTDYTAMLAEYPAKLAILARFFEDHGLRHTLGSEDGSTYYDQGVSQMDFRVPSPATGGAFFTMARAVGPVLAKAKSLKARRA